MNIIEAERPHSKFKGYSITVELREEARYGRSLLPGWVTKRHYQAYKDGEKKYVSSSLKQLKSFIVSLG